MRSRLSTICFGLGGRNLSRPSVQFCCFSRRFKSDDKLVSSKDSSSVDEFKVLRTTSKSAPAPIGKDLGLEKMMKQDNKPYIPKMLHKRVSYEYPGLPNEDSFSKHSNASREKKTVGRWSRYIPRIITVVVVAWGCYVVKIWYFDEDDAAKSNDLLDPNEFHKFRITHKEQIDSDHYLIEIKPVNSHWQYSYYTNYDSKSIWNGDRIWSVEVKQPEIMVVRAYTPLPLYFMQSEYTYSGEKKPLLRVINNDLDDYDKGGTFCFYIKKYNDGEVSRFIVNKNVGDELEIRGPHVEFKFPYHPLKQVHQRPIFRDLPSKIESEHLIENIKRANKIPEFDNLDFYAAGTGIAPILQVLLSRNPYRGFVNVHYSAQRPEELKPLERFLFFLEKIDRIKLVNHFDSSLRTVLKKSDIKPPQKSNYLSPQKLEEKSHELSAEEALKLRMRILAGEPEEKERTTDLPRPPRFANAVEQALETSKQKKRDASLAIVCGPDGYVEYVAGKKSLATNEQGPVQGLLGEKEWDNSNVHKL